MNASTDWGSALAILAAGLVLGTLVFLVLRRRKTSFVNKRTELEARRDALVQELRELGDDVADNERTSLERETAEVLQALDRLPTAPAKAAAPRRRNPALTGFAWGVAFALVAGSIVYYGSTFTKERGSEATAQTGAQAGAQSGAADVKQLEEAVQRDPGNIDQRIALAKAYFGNNDLMASFEQTKAVLDQNPREPRALTYNAVVRMAMGELEGARIMLEQATEGDPNLLDAWVALASVRTQSGDARGASAAIAAAIAQHPEEEGRLRSVFAQIQKQAPPAGQPAATAASRLNMPPDHPPLPDVGAVTPSAHATPPGATPLAAPSKPIHITLSLDPSATVKSGVVYVIARGGAGHPLAVRRVEATAFPLTLELGGGDSMMSAPLPDKFRLEARLDTDGDAGTKDASDPRAALDGVSAGATVALTLGAH